MALRDSSEVVITSADCPHKIGTWTEMRNYIKSQLGAPVVCVEVDDEQINNNIEECVQLVQRYLMDEGYFFEIISHQLIKGVGEYHIDFPIYKITKILHHNQDTEINNWFSGTHQVMYTDILNGNLFGGGSNADGNRGLLGNFSAQMNYLKDIEIEFGTNLRPHWSELSNTLRVYPTPNEDQKVGLVCYMKESCINIFNNILFKKLVVAAVGIKWARNLVKYSALTLPGGSQIAASDLMTTYVTQYDAVLESIRGEGHFLGFSFG